MAHLKRNDMYNRFLSFSVNQSYDMQYYLEFKGN